MTNKYSLISMHLQAIQKQVAWISFALWIVISLPSKIWAQEVIMQEKESVAKTEKKGSMYLYWGWNRSWYANSNLHFKGYDYDFNLKSVRATDRQSPFSTKVYLNPSNATIPQYNFRIGYFINSKYNISLGIDHMKYVVTQDQIVGIDGSINLPDSPYNGLYSGQNIALKEDFLKFEHTDGLNFVNVDIRRFYELWTTKKVTFNVMGGLGAGVMIPRTDATLLGKPRHDEFHLSGYGFSGVAGINASFWKYFFIQSEFKLGYISMPDILTTYDAADKADQRIMFSQFNVVFGGNIYL
ncbi:MAG: hypothetical protein LC107_13185 [Chitinophagales bacterium]|nr:hypothetical protein [Chitinophagales bacterium]